MTVTRAPFGALQEGGSVEMFAFANTNGVEVRAISFGATIVSIRTPDRGGRIDDVVLGFDRLDDYLTRARYFGSIVGRYGNRIARGRFTIDGSTFQLTVNNGANHLHGGLRGFDRVIWKGEPFEQKSASGVTFTYLSPDGEEGYPGTVRATVTYTLTARSELVLDYTATTDKPTPINLTNHSYFNLMGRDRGDILQHRLALHADRYLPTDEAQIPTGEIAAVAATPFDFRKPAAIGDRINADHEQIGVCPEFSRGPHGGHSIPGSSRAPGRAVAASVILDAPPGTPAAGFRVRHMPPRPAGSDASPSGIGAPKAPSSGRPCEPNRTYTPG